MKTGDLDGFLAGSVQYTRQRLEAQGLDLPDPVRGRGSVTERAAPSARSCCTADEVTAARAVLVAAGELPDGAAVVHIVLDEPDKASAGGVGRRAIRSTVGSGPWSCPARS